MAALAVATGARAQTYTVLKNFNANINATGYQPIGTLARGADGTLYGVAEDGGAGGAGVVFRIQSDGSHFTIIKNFPLVNVVTGTNSDGANPSAGLLLSGTNLYGTTVAGGSGGQGTVFSLGTNGAGFTVLKSFPPIDPSNGTNLDGAQPRGTLILAGGALYGTAQAGGTFEWGTIFRLSTNGSGFTNIYNFTGDSDGAIPMAGLLASGSTLYGTASSGGDSGLGTVFSVGTNGSSFNPLHSFSGTGTDGSTPLGSLVLSGGMLYGTTQHGDSGDGSDDGTVFRISTGGGGFTNLHSFVDAEGFYPVAELLLSGSTLYGTTGNGGGGSFFGTVFQVNTDGTGFSRICNLTGNGGWGPQCGLVLSGTTLYGTTVNGGLLPTVFAFANGTVFSVDVNGSGLNDLCIFPGPNGASQPNTGLALSGGTLFGTTIAGGTNNNGTVFQISTNGTGFADIHDFTLEDSNGDNPDGGNPRAVPVLSGGVFYGTTRYGGTSGWGTVYRMNGDGSGFTNIFSFDNTNPELPITTLAVGGNMLYGAGTSGSFGSAYSMTTNGGSFSNIYTFNGTDGKFPTAGFVLSGNVLYGSSQLGGAGSGNIFQMNTDGTHYTNIYSFTGGNDGASPGTLLVLSGGTLYGTAYHGGSGGQGTVFKVNTDHTAFAVLHTFTGTNSDGAAPGDLLLSGGTLYGITANGGTSDHGTVFALDIASTNYTVLKNFAGGSDGANPNTTLVLSSNTLYGTTQFGGLAGQGTVFSLTVTPTVTPIPLSITHVGTNVILTWAGAGWSLQSAPQVIGTYSNISGATSPYTNAVTGTEKFYRLQSN